MTQQYLLVIESDLSHDRYSSNDGYQREGLTQSQSCSHREERLFVQAGCSNLLQKQKNSKSFAFPILPSLL